MRYDTPKSVKVISVIEVKSLRGVGKHPDPIREVSQYYDFEGKLLAEYDPLPTDGKTVARCP